MAYSRWGGSRWYTFWAVQDEEAENRLSAYFEICPIATFEAHEIRNNIERCLNNSVEKEEQTFPNLSMVSDAEREELRAYMLEFLADVDSKYPE